MAFQVFFLSELWRNRLPHHSALSAAKQIKAVLEFHCSKAGPQPRSILFASSMKVNSTCLFLAMSAETGSCWAATSSVLLFTKSVLKLETVYFATDLLEQRKHGCLYCIKARALPEVFLWEEASNPNYVSLERQLTSLSVTQKYLVSVLRYHIQNGVLSISPFSGANEQLGPPITLGAALIKSGMNQ